MRATSIFSTSVFENQRKNFAFLKSKSGCEAMRGDVGKTLTTMVNQKCFVQVMKNSGVWVGKIDMKKPEKMLTKGLKRGINK